MPIAEMSPPTCIITLRGTSPVAYATAFGGVDTGHHHGKGAHERSQHGELRAARQCQRHRHEQRRSRSVAHERADAHVDESNGRPHRPRAARECRQINSGKIATQTGLLHGDTTGEAPHIRMRIFDRSEQGRVRTERLT